MSEPLTANLLAELSDASRDWELAGATWWEAMANLEDSHGDMAARDRSRAHAAEIRARHMTDAERDAVDAKADAAQAARETH